MVVALPTAIVRGDASVLRRIFAGNGIAHYLWTDVYLQGNGQWQVVATQGSEGPPAKPRTESKSSG
jgi:hypothetical protein